MGCLQRVAKGDWCIFSVSCSIVFYTNVKEHKHKTTFWRQGIISDRNTTSNWLFTCEMTLCFFGSPLEAKPLTFGNTAGHIRQLQNTSEGDSLIGGWSNEL